MKYIVFSKALHSTWVMSCEYSALFDCGEGCSTMLGHAVFIPDKLFISHSHIDHIAGLPAFLGLRNSTKGANDKPLTIYYPAGNRRIEDWIQFSTRALSRFKYPLQVTALTPNQVIELPTKEGSRENRFVHAFPVEHANEPCFGYRIFTHAKRMKAEFRGKPQEFYRTLTAESKAQMHEEVEQTKLFYSGDAMPLSSGPKSPLNGAEVAFLDGTFLKASDRDKPTHAALDELAQKCEIAGVKTAYVLHLSVRYSMREIQDHIDALSGLYPLKAISYDRVHEIN